MKKHMRVHLGTTKTCFHCGNIFETTIEQRTHEKKQSCETVLKDSLNTSEQSEINKSEVNYVNTSGPISRIWQIQFDLNYIFFEWNISETLSYCLGEHKGLRLNEEGDFSPVSLLGKPKRAYESGQT